MNLILLEKQVCNLELARRLEELNVKQESLFWWSTHTIPSTLWNRDDLDKSLEGYEGPAFSTYAAFTVAELGEMLPADILNLEHKGLSHGFYFDHKKRGAGADTEADARAKMLIYLVENKLVTLSENS
jgi:hypothetical protein